MKQHVLIVGSSAAEHAIAWKLMQSPRVGKVSVAPGNGGTTNNVPIAATDIDGLVRWATENKPDLTVIGSAQALAAGIVDAFQAAGLRVFGPTKSAAQIGSSRVFAKQFMQRHHMPTAPFEVFDNARAAIGYLLTEGDKKLVIRADGLTDGKGVYLTDCAHDAENAVRELMVSHTAGEAGARIVIEQQLEGEEWSLIGFSDGIHIQSIGPANVYTRIYDGDVGPHTGGSGAISWVTGMHIHGGHPVDVVIDGMGGEGTPFVGALSARFMRAAKGLPTLEYNAHFGDPETQVILPRLETDILDIFEACLEGTLDKVKIVWGSDCTATVVMASGGYPGNYEVGKSITGLDDVPEDVLVFHAGTRHDGNQIVTAGGSVLSVTGFGPDLQSALDRAYTGVHAIHFEGVHYRTDIGAKTLAQLEAIKRKS